MIKEYGHYVTAIFQLCIKDEKVCIIFVTIDL